MARITRTITTPDAGIGDHRVWAGQPKSGRHAGTDRASISLAIADLAGSPELLALVGGQRISVTFGPEVARLIARDVPDTRPAWAAVGIKPAPKSAKLGA